MYVIIYDVPIEYHTKVFLMLYILVEVPVIITFVNSSVLYSVRQGTGPVFYWFMYMHHI